MVLGLGDPGPKQCHPRVGRSRPAHGCLPVDVLEEAATMLKIKGKGPSLRKVLEKAMGVAPEKEYSFLQALPFTPARKAELAKMWLRPPMPEAWKKDPDMWLDSLNIAGVMNQFEDSNQKFELV